MVGRRGGKSRIAALVAVFLACFRDYGDKLAPGERAVVMVLAADRRQARVVFRYIRAFLGVPLLRQMVTGEIRESIDLSNGASIEIHTSNFKSVRGYSIAAVICDEIAFWQSDIDGANPDAEVLAGLRPGMATIQGALLLAISSPYARRGTLWEAYRRHHGQHGDVLVWQADTESMNPSVDAQVIADAYQQDEAAAAAEFGAEFRKDIESFVSRESVEAVTIRGRHELPPDAETGMFATRYRAFVDPSGGSVDSFTCAIAHRHDSKAVLDCVIELKAPFNPREATEQIAEVLRRYSITKVTGDRYGGEFPRSLFKEQGISYEPATPTARASPFRSSNTPPASALPRPGRCGGCRTTDPAPVDVVDRKSCGASAHTRHKPFFCRRTRTTIRATGSPNNPRTVASGRAPANRYWSCSRRCLPIAKSCQVLRSATEVSMPFFLMSVYFMFSYIAPDLGLPGGIDSAAPAVLRGQDRF